MDAPSETLLQKFNVQGCHRLDHQDYDHSEEAGRSQVAWGDGSVSRVLVMQAGDLSLITELTEKI